MMVTDMDSLLSLPKEQLAMNERKALSWFVPFSSQPSPGRGHLTKMLPLWEEYVCGTTCVLLCYLVIMIGPSKLASNQLEWVPFVRKRLWIKANECIATKVEFCGLGPGCTLRIVVHHSPQVRFPKMLTLSAIRESQCVIRLRSL